MRVKSSNRFIDEPQYNPTLKIQLSYVTDNSTEIIQAAIAGLNQMFQDGYRYNMVGVMVGGLIQISEYQTSLLDRYDREAVAHLMLALDHVNTTFGPGKLRFGAQGMRQATWQMRHNHLFPDNNRGL